MASIKRFHQDGCQGEDCQCPWRLDYRPQGLAGPRQRIEFPTKKAAEKHLASTAVKVSRGEYIEPAKIPTFEQASQEWFREKSDRHPATVQGWRVHVRHLAKLNPIRLDRIDVAVIEGVRDELRARLSPKTIGAILTTCAAIFKLAIRRGYTTSNPAAIAERPRKRVAELTPDADSTESGQGLRAVRPDEVLSAEEIRRLIEHAEPGLFRTLFATIAATGLRSEEAFALKWSDIQLHDCRLFVRRSLSWARKPDEKGRVRPKFYEPKTRAGYRAMPLPAGLVAALKVWKLQSPKSEHDLVFCRADGQPLHRSNVLRQGLYPALRRAELRGANIKTLRHSYASGLIASGAPITEVQHRLGHSNPAVTLKVYSHWFRDADTGAADRFAEGFLPVLEKSGQKVGTETYHKKYTGVGQAAKTLKL
jgi:integrase